MSSLFLQPAYILAVLIAITIHEWAHAYSAYLLGDDTAKYQGRLTWNPLAHLDPMGSLMFLVVGFGWAKPVPVNPRNLRDPKRDSAIIAIAGPLSNLVLAVVAFIGLVLLTETQPSGLFGLLRVGEQSSVLVAFLAQLCGASLFINLGLMAFNLLPIAPLDGSKVLYQFIPYQYEEEYLALMDRGPYILLGIIILERIGNMSLLGWWVFGITEPILNVMYTIAGAVL